MKARREETTGKNRRKTTSRWRQRGRGFLAKYWTYGMPSETAGHIENGKRTKRKAGVERRNRFFKKSHHQKGILAKL